MSFTHPSPSDGEHLTFDELVGIWQPKLVDDVHRGPYKGGVFSALITKKTPIFDMFGILKHSKELSTEEKHVVAMADTILRQLRAHGQLHPDDKHLPLAALYTVEEIIRVDRLKRTGRSHMRQWVNDAGEVLRTQVTESDGSVRTVQGGELDHVPGIGPFVGIPPDYTKHLLELVKEREKASGEKRAKSCDTGESPQSRRTWRAAGGDAPKAGRKGSKHTVHIGRHGAVHGTTLFDNVGRVNETLGVTGKTRPAFPKSTY